MKTTTHDESEAAALEARAMRKATVYTERSTDPRDTSGSYNFRRSVRRELLNTQGYGRLEGVDMPEALRAALLDSEEADGELWHVFCTTVHWAGDRLETKRKHAAQLALYEAWGTR
jgi:hypothetical protein